MMISTSKRWVKHTFAVKIYNKNSTGWVHVGGLNSHSMALVKTLVQLCLEPSTNTNFFFTLFLCVDLTAIQSAQKKCL